MIFMLSAVDALWHHGCVTPLYSIFSWHLFGFI